MSFITFIYRINNDPKIYYGKYVTDYISKEHEGLDLVVKYDLIDGLNKHRFQKNDLYLNEFEYDDSNIKVGILSYSYENYIPCYSTDSEIECFDFYEICHYFQKKIYVNGKLLE